MSRLFVIRAPLLRVCLVLAIPLILIGCTSKAYVLTGTSFKSSSDAATDLHVKLRRAEKEQCYAVSLGAGTGVGFSVDECTVDNPVGEQKIYSTQVLIKCPSGVHLDELEQSVASSE